MKLLLAGAIVVGAAAVSGGQVAVRPQRPTPGYNAAPAYSEAPPGYAPPPPAYYAPARSCWDPYYQRYYAC